MPPIAPNTLTAARLPLAPLAVWCMTWGTPSGYILAAVLALLLEATDIADGWIARSYSAVSDFGKLFDPFADAVCRFSLFLGLYAIDQASLWMILAIFYRDSSVAFLRSIAATRQVVISARKSGKIKAIVQGVGTQVCFLALVAAPFYPAFEPVPWWSMLVITVVTMASLVDYMHGNRTILLDAWHDRRTAL